MWAVTTEDGLAATTPRELAGRVVIVAGGGLSGPEGGIGFSYAWLAARCGAAVAVLDRDGEAAARTVEALRSLGAIAKAYVVDMTDAEALRREIGAVVKEFGRIDAVCDSVGGGSVADLLEASDLDWLGAFQVNVHTAWNLLRALDPHLRSGSALVFVSSRSVVRRASGSAYAVAKAALERLVVGAAAGMAARGVRVNCVQVGMIWGAFAARGMTDAQRSARRANIALRTEGNPWDVASAALFLTTPASRWITGQVLSVDGGGETAPNVGQAGSGSSPNGA